MKSNIKINGEFINVGDTYYTYNIKTKSMFEVVAIENSDMNVELRYFNTIDEVLKHSRTPLPKFSVQNILDKWKESYGEDMEELYPRFIEKLRQNI